MNAIHPVTTEAAAEDNNQKTMVKDQNVNATLQAGGGGESHEMQDLDPETTRGRNNTFPSTSTAGNIQEEAASDAGLRRRRRRMTVDDVDKLPLHPDDRQVVEDGMDPTIAKALRNRRDKLYPNDIDGPVHSGKLSKWIVFSYTAPSFSTVPLTLLISIYIVQFYEKLGADLARLAFFQALARGFDVITDPSMSYLTDSWRGKSGRRRPFMATGCIPYGLALFFLMSPFPSFNSDEVSSWFGAFYIIFFLFNTYTNIPYDALGPELTDNPDDRSTLFFVATLFDGLGAICATLFPVIGQVFFAMNRKVTSESCHFPNEEGRITLQSCGSDLAESIGLGSTLTNDQACRSWALNGTAESLGFSDSICDDTFDATLDEFIGNSSNFCHCLADCKVVNRLDNARGAYCVVGLFFALWYIISMLNAVKQVKERSQITGRALPPPPPMLPSMLNTFQNRAFSILLPAWICDALVNSIVASLLTYFVRYIVEPEFHDERCQGGKASGPDVPIFCNSETVLGACVAAVLFMAFLFTPMWLLLVRKIGKRNTWLLWSATMAFTNLTFFFVGKGDITLCIVLSGLNGIPMGAKFLADAILADVIDYDEFLTGQRSEATYTMFKSFLPKIAAIPASAIPIALLGVFGHIPPKEGVVQEQLSTCIRPYIVIAIVAIPSTLSIIAFILKLRFPLRTVEQNLKISEGIGKHLVGMPAICPISGVYYNLVPFTDKEREEAYHLDAFTGSKVIERMLEDTKKEQDRLLRRAYTELTVAVIAMVGAAVWVGATFNLLDTSDAGGEPVCLADSENETESFFAYRDSEAWCDVRIEGLEVDLSFVPVLGVVVFGVTVTGVFIAVLRVIGARLLSKRLPTKDIMEKVYQSRKQIEKCREFDTSFRSSCRSHTIPRRDSVDSIIYKDTDSDDEGDQGSGGCDDERDHGSNGSSGSNPAITTTEDADGEDQYNDGNEDQIEMVEEDIPRNGSVSLTGPAPKPVFV